MGVGIQIQYAKVRTNTGFTVYGTLVLPAPAWQATSVLTHSRARGGCAGSPSHTGAHRLT